MMRRLTDEQDSAFSTTKPAVDTSSVWLVCFRSVCGGRTLRNCGGEGEQALAENVHHLLSGPNYSRVIQLVPRLGAETLDQRLKCPRSVAGPRVTGKVGTCSSYSCPPTECLVWLFEAESSAGLDTFYLHNNL